MFNKALLDHRHSPFNSRYLERLENVMACAIAEYPRTFALRVDLHFSPEWAADDSICCHPNTSRHGALYSLPDSKDRPLSPTTLFERPAGLFLQVTLFLGQGN